MNGRADKRILMAAIALMLAPPSAAATAQEDRAVPVIPAEFRSVVRAVSPDRLVVTALDGRPIPVDIEYYVPSRFSLHQRGRYLGFAVDGHEANGYLMVDRSAPAHEAVAETGIAPTFSPDGLYFAAAEMSIMRAAAPALRMPAISSGPNREMAMRHCARGASLAANTNLVWPSVTRICYT